MGRFPRRDTARCSPPSRGNISPARFTRRRRRARARASVSSLSIGKAPWRYSIGQDYGCSGEELPRKVAGPRSGRLTVNKETVAFYQVLKLANDRGLISSIPWVRQLKQRPAPERPLLSPADIECLLRHCTTEATKNAHLLKVLSPLSGHDRSTRKGSSPHPLGRCRSREATRHDRRGCRQ
jgi:hypothetical protein